MAMARLDATGCSVDEVMAQTGYSRGTISAIRMSPLYKLYVRKLREQITEKLTDNYADRILAQTGKSLDVVEEIRDSDQTPPAVPTDENVPLVVPDLHNPRFSYGGGKIISELMAVLSSVAPSPAAPNCSGRGRSSPTPSAGG